MPSEKTETEKRIEAHLQDDRTVPLRQAYLDICKWDKRRLKEPKRNYSTRREVNCALMLQQLIFWTDRADPKNGKWVAKSAKEWEEELGLTESQVASARLKLLHLGFIETRTGPFNAKNTTWYRIKEENINYALDHRFEIQERQPEINVRQPVIQDREPGIHEL